MRRVRFAVIALASFVVSRTLLWIARELVEHRENTSRLRTDWTPIEAVASAGVLRIHARGADHASDALPPAVLVHGYGVGGTYLVPLAAHLSNRTRVYAPDLPGHGRSDHEVRPLTISELAEALARWMDARGVRSALVVGHSLGCQVAVEAAARRPDLVTALVLIGPTSDPCGRSLRQQLVRLLVSSVFERPIYAIWTALEYWRAGLRVLAHEMRQMITHRIEDVLPRVQAPIKIVRGGRDRVASLAWAEALASRVQAPMPVTIGGWGHAVHFDEPETVAAIALASFRSRVARETASRTRNLTLPPSVMGS